MLSKRFIPAVSFCLFALTLPTPFTNAYASETPCTAKVKEGTQKFWGSKWGTLGIPHSKDWHFGAQRTEGVTNGPELITRRAVKIPRIYLYDIEAKCDTLPEWNGDIYYFQKWYSDWSDDPFHLLFN